nr:hypothetical transcript [Hymenolepis microstoma]
MDKASDFGSEDCRFESCQGRGGNRGRVGFLAGATHRPLDRRMETVESGLARGLAARRSNRLSYPASQLLSRVVVISTHSLTLTHTHSHSLKPHQASAKHQFTLRLTKCDTTGGSRLLSVVTATATAW